jgi:hypothetical protein
VGVDNAWEQEKLEARKMLENAAESPASSARFVGRSAASIHARYHRSHQNRAKLQFFFSIRSFV